MFLFGAISYECSYNDEEDFAVNEKNRFYNKQLSKYYDKYNADVRASIERGGGL